jgi:hypothetical protein
MRLKDNNPPIKVLTLPKLRWKDQVAEDAARAGCRKWKRTTHIREDWRKLLKEDKAHPGL